MTALTDIVPWLSLAALVISIGTSVTTFLTSGAKHNAQTLAQHDKRIQKLENQLEHLPDSGSAHRLELAIERLNGRIETLDERLKPVAAISERMQELLLEQAKR
ncbi:MULTISPECIES: DUF2730 family protein [Nitratireductor]|uniref:DUF2730 family protein n=1 Tax=Nitratireductor sp. GZWM139 TaxID=2950541 RepID=UPI0024BDE64E|nr:DUF2730 family protein [Nitratireductor sp. GZWM139]MDJ1463422.1 DUF2730 domain-containing protein [Nitratireductor sp. GZWM139]